MTRVPDILDLIRNGKLSLPPAELRVLNVELTVKAGVYSDAVIEGRWAGQCVRFLAEVKKLATPKSLRQAIATARDVASPPATYPMVVVPYLSPTKLAELEAAMVSGVDLCGNGVLVVPGQMLIFRSGQPNRYPQSVKLKNVYRGKNSLVPRAFLIQPSFSQVKGIVELLAQRRGRVAFSTVSKVIKRLEEELVISRTGDTIRLIQADVLLEKLAANYEPPDIVDRYRGKCDLPGSEIVRRLMSAASGQKDKVIMTGAVSAEKYAAMAREPVLSVYTSMSPRELLTESNTDVKETDLFANLEILQTTDARVFFDPRVEDGLPIACPVQAYLELANGDKRQKDVAQQVRRGILDSLDSF